MKPNVIKEPDVPKTLFCKLFNFSTRSLDLLADYRHTWLPLLLVPNEGDHVLKLHIALQRKDVVWVFVADD